jgi:glycosyltransferase involved in cell wall biosynthesis
MRVLAFTPSNWEHALTVLRIVGPLQAAGIQVELGNEDINRISERVGECDLVVVQRDFPRQKAFYHSVMACARQLGKKLVYDLDDLLWALPEDHPDRQTHYYAHALLPMLLAAVEADAVTVVSRPLLEYVRLLNPNTWLLPNFLHDGIWHLRPPRLPQDGTAAVRLGYMGGNSHLPDLLTVLPVLVQLLERNGGAITLKFWGLKPPEALLAYPNVEWQPLAVPDYYRFAEFFLQQECDVFIAPLQPSFFNECKSAVKFLEYTALGAPGVYSAGDPYRQVVQHGINGFLATSLQEWNDCLTRLVENPALRYDMALQAQETIRSEWLLSKNAPRWPEAYRQILASPPATDWQVSRRVLQELLPNIADQLASWQRDREDLISQQESNLRELRHSNDKMGETAEALRQELAEIRGSAAWNMVYRLRRLRLAAFPPGSWRERLWDKLLSRLR